VWDLGYGIWDIEKTTKSAPFCDFSGYILHAVRRFGGLGKARKLVSHVYGLCRQPSLTRDYGIKDQIRRASVSVMSNLAEGFERTHKAEKIHLYKIARASAGEVRSLLYVIEDQEAAEADQLEELRKLVDAVGKLVTGLIRSTEKYIIGK